MHRSNVLLPQPEGPMRHTTWCSSTTRSTPWSTWLSPNHLCTPSISRNDTSAGLRAELFALEPSIDIAREWDGRDEEQHRGRGDRCEVEVVAVEQTRLVEHFEQPDEADE